MSDDTEAQDEAANAEELAKARWGPTGFCCPYCRHHRAYLIKARPRVRECQQCRRQTSVTSGTLMHRTRLRLAVWKRRGEQAQSDSQIPTSRASAAQLGISLSTAWLLTQKLLCAMTRRGPSTGQYDLFWMRVRLPHPERPMAHLAPEPVRAMYERYRRGRERRWMIGCVLERDLPHAQMADVIVSKHDEILYFSPGARKLKPHYQDLVHELLEELIGRHQLVSLRWLPRWLGALLSWWNRDPAEFAWLPAALAFGPRPLHLLDPWLDPQGEGLLSKG